MKVYYSSDELPVFNKAVVTIGTFDGVHLGHQQILEQLKQEAGRIGGETVIITFHPHPRKVVPGSQPIYLINTIEEKIMLLQNQGIDHVVVVPFTTEFAQQSPEDYIEKFLVAKFKPHTIIIGYDHRFGQGRKGDYKLLEALSARFGYLLVEIPGQVIKESTVSSTRIREAVLKGDIATADELLGYNFFFQGLVVDGKKLGRALGYPTANLQIENAEKLVPGNGIYVVTAALVGWHTEVFGGMMSIGVRPTIGVTERTIEVNIFDFDREIYGDRIVVSVLKYLREEMKFNNLEELKEQLAVDKKDSLEFLNRS
jgi:riboflavin kinase / FMN adenylyltransferase